MKEVQGDLIKLAKKGEFDVIVHGCNAFVTMGAGIAKFIKRSFPEAYEADCATSKGDKSKLGTNTEALSKGVCVVNAYIQFHYKGHGCKADYDAIRSCMRHIKEDHSGKRIGLPLIGCGLAGGSWSKVKTIIEEELGDEDVTIVHFQK